MTSIPLPPGWDVRVVKDLLRVQYGKALDIKARVAGGRYPVLGSGGEMARTGESLISCPAVVIGRKGNVGAVQLLTSGGWPIDTTYFAAVPDEFDPRFLFHQLTAMRLDRLDSSTATPSLRRPDLEDQELVLPPLGEQRRIVGILEDHLSRLDAASLLLRGTRLRLRVLHKSVLLGLIPDECDYPSHWIRSTVAGAGGVGLGRQRHPDWHNGPNMRPYLRVANVFEDRITVNDIMEMHWPGNSFDRFRLRPGDVLLNEGQSPEFLGRPAIYLGEPPDVAFTNSLIRFRAGEGVLPAFALLVFRRHMHAGRFTRESRITTNIAHLSTSRLKTIEFPLPPIDEQRALVEVAEQRLGASARLRDQVGLLELENKALKHALFEAAFSGRLTDRSSDMAIMKEIAGV